MLTALKTKLNADSPRAEAARRVYAKCLTQTRQPVFYEQYGVDDTFEGRFELLLVHIFCVIFTMKEKDKEFNQALFDAAFADMDQTLREMGIGDMGIPKHMKRMMKAFNGHIQAYNDALMQSDDAMKQTLKRNLYGLTKDISDNKINMMEKYIKKTIQHLGAQPVYDIQAGTIHFIEGDKTR